MPSPYLPQRLSYHPVLHCTAPRRHSLQVVVHQVANVEVDDDPSNPNIAASTMSTTGTELLAWGGLGQVVDLPAFKLAVRLNGTVHLPRLPGRRSTTCLVPPHPVYCSFLSERKRAPHSTRYLATLPTSKLRNVASCGALSCATVLWSADASPVCYLRSCALPP